MHKTVPYRSIWSLFGLVILTGVSYVLFQSYVIPGVRKIWTLIPETTTLVDLSLMPVPIVGYLLIAGNFCLVVNLFRPLKRWDEDKLISGLILGLVMSLILVFIFGAIIVFSMGLNWCLFGSIYTDGNPVGKLIIAINLSVLMMLTLILFSSAWSEFKRN